MTDSDPDCSTDRQGSPSGLPQAMARTHPHSARVCEGSGWPAATQSTANFLSCHQNPCVQASGTGQTAFPGCKSRVSMICHLCCHHSLLNILRALFFSFLLLVFGHILCLSSVLFLMHEEVLNPFKPGEHLCISTFKTVSTVAHFYP